MGSVSESGDLINCFFLNRVILDKSKFKFLLITTGIKISLFIIVYIMSKDTPDSVNLILSLVIIDPPLLLGNAFIILNNIQIKMSSTP